MRKRCKRKVWPLIDTIEHAKQMAAVTSKDDLDSVRMYELSAIESMCTGRAERSDWDHLADMVNVMETLIDMRVIVEAKPYRLAGHAALGSIRERFHRTGQMGVSGPELEALREAFRWHDAQRTKISRNQYAEAIRLTKERIRSAPHTVKVYA